MEFILSNLIATLQTTTHHLKTTAAPILKSTLHDPDSLPNPEIWDLTLTALDALSNLRLLLEPGHLILADHFLGYTDTKCLVAAVDLRIPDALSSGPKTLPELASHVGANPLRLRQILLTLVNNGIFEYDREKYEYENNRVSILLLEGHWTQWKSWVNVYGNEFYDMARGIPEAVKEGVARTPAQINYDTDDSMFKYFADRNWLGKVQEAMSGGAIAQATGILQDYPWEEIVDMAILDVGGGVGGLVASLLRRFETMTGGILDRKDVIDVAKLNFHTEGGQYADVGGRVPGTSLVAGDFFEHVPKSEVYVMKWCLHNWNDEKASVILKNIRRSIQKGPKSRLIILESVLKDGHVGRISRYADLNMFVAIGGKEREAEEWEKLATETGWNLSRIYPLRNAWPSAIEFIPNWCASLVLDQQQESKTVVVASMRFLEPWDPSRGNPYIRISPDEGYDRMNFKWEDYKVHIHDARSMKDHFMLDTHGFAYYDDQISPELVGLLRQNEKDTVRELYYPQVENLVKRATGATRVIIFDHTQRKRRLELDNQSNDDGKEQPATMVHCDQSVKGAIRRLRLNIGPREDIETVLKSRVQMINVWRPLTEPVQDWPLATMDYQTAKETDMHPCDLLKGVSEERGQTATFTQAEDQKWYYLSNQKSNEVTMIKIWDTLDGASKFCAHAAFNHPSAPVDATPRESVEVRCLVIHEPADAWFSTCEQCTSGTHLPGE